MKFLGGLRRRKENFNAVNDGKEQLNLAHDSGVEGPGGALNRNGA